MQLQSAGIDLSAVFASVCRYFSIDEKGPAGSTMRLKIARARVLIGYIAVRDLLISGNEVASRLNVDRWAISRAVQRVGQ